MNAFQIVSKALGVFSTGWEAIGAFLHRIRFFLIWLALAACAVFITARATYWYKAVYEPAQELKANPPITIEQIMENLDVTLGDFDMPQGLGSTYFNNSFLFSLTPEKAWSDEAASSLWIPASEMGIQEISKDSDEAMKQIVSNLP